MSNTIAGKSVGQTGYGMLGLTWDPFSISNDEAFAVLNTALEGGANYWNGGVVYSYSKRNSLNLLEQYFDRNPSAAEQVVLSIKAAPGDIGPGVSELQTSIHQSVEECLKMIGRLKKIDVFQFARTDARVPIELVVQILAKYVEEGKIGGIGLSKVDAETIRRAHAIHPIAAVEVELSLWSRDILTNGVAQTCADLGIPIIAYSPLGHGFLTGSLTSPQQLEPTDIRRRLARFQSGVFENNLELVKELNKVAEKKSCSMAQLALAWVRSYSLKDGFPFILPIPGSITASNVAENCVSVLLCPEELDEVNRILESSVIVGGKCW